MRKFHVYIVANSRRTLYIGATNNLLRRIGEHKSGDISGYSSRYKLKKLVWHQEFATALEAIAFEKQIKGWKRERKIEMIETMNPFWRDLAIQWFAPDDSTGQQEAFSMLTKTNADNTLNG